MKPRLLAIVATLLTTALAGCVGQFEVIQTEPIRIQIDDADGEESRIGAAGCCPGENASEKQEFEFEAPDDVEKVVVIVEVTKVTTQGGASPTTATPATTGNGTGNQTTSPPAGNQTSGEPCIVLVIVQEKDSGRKLAE
ncbi:MAG TPA: hypothetical protein VI818_02980, partial [Candidatus Thermoplasmatota archaeon]|nr:hypothetical protein [Candidatus Thermoplasmatota archaeon]